jgi:DNA adenine methylase
MSSTKYQKPFLKWVGGKSQIMDTLLEKFPKEMNNYHEPFLGGGSVLLAVLTLRKENKLVIKNKIYAYDVNDRLITIFNHVKNNKNELFETLQLHRNVYDNLKGEDVNRKPTNEHEALTSKESYYYWLRNKYNSVDVKSIESSALFLFLNKTCFRGMYREGPKGFNVPYGHYKKTPILVSKEDLDNISDLIQDVTFAQSDFSSSINQIKKGDFVYLDPPYVPEKESSFVNYVKEGFDTEMHTNLFNNVKTFKNNSIQFVMSNAKVNFVMDSFKDYSYEEIIARRSINSKNPGSTASEVLIYN